MPLSMASPSSALPLPRSAARLASASCTAFLASSTPTLPTANLGCHSPSFKGFHCHFLLPFFPLVALLSFLDPCKFALKINECHWLMYNPEIDSALKLLPASQNSRVPVTHRLAPSAALPYVRKKQC